MTKEEMQAFALEEASNLVGNMTELTNSGKIQWVCTDALPICLVKDIVSDELEGMVLQRLSAHGTYRNTHFFTTIDESLHVPKGNSTCTVEILSVFPGGRRRISLELYAKIPEQKRHNFESALLDRIAESPLLSEKYRKEEYCLGEVEPEILAHPLADYCRTLFQNGDIRAFHSEVISRKVRKGIEGNNAAL